jgi:hypothetical protein
MLLLFASNLCFYFALTYIYVKFQACHGLHYYKPNTASSPPIQELQKQEARDDLVIGGEADLIGKYEVHVPELHETHTMLNSVSPSSKVSTSAKLARLLYNLL